jgi:hypothetical protein
MKNKFIISTIIIIISTIQLFGNGFRIVKGKVVDNKDEVFIGAQIEEYKNGLNYVNSDINGEFEIVIPQKETVILRITYGCSAFYDVLYEVKAEDTYVRIEAYTKKADKKTKKIQSSRVSSNTLPLLIPLTPPYVRFSYTAVHEPWKSCS